MTPPRPGEDLYVLAAAVHGRLRAGQASVAVAESLTGGALGAALSEVPGASATFRGGVIAYATDVKHSLLGVDADLLAERGPVDAEVAAQMAGAVRRVLDATYGVALTGVAGPDAPAGHLPGTVFAAVAGPEGIRVLPLSLTGDRAAVRRAAVYAALDLLGAAIDG